MTTDSGADIKKAVRNILNINHFSCFCYNLHIFLFNIKNFNINKCNCLIEKSKEITKFFKYSSVNINIF